MINADEALQRLRDGNQRFANNQSSFGNLNDPHKRSELAAAQQPFAIILGCSDSRVPAEIVFDQGLGDLFVIRVAGNIVAPSQIGSVEFAISSFGTPLVVVLGHSRCGAVLSTIEVLRHGNDDASSNIMSIVNRVKPAVEGLMHTNLKNDPAALTDAAVRANVRVSASQLRHGSELIENRVRGGDVMIVGAEYDLESGVVDFFDGVPG